MDPEALSTTTDVISSACLDLRDSDTPPESLVGCPGETERPTTSPFLHENAAVITPTNHSPTPCDSERSSGLFSADSNSSPADVSNDDDPFKAPGNDEDSRILSVAAICEAMERDSNKLTNGSVSDPLDLDSSHELLESRESVSEKTPVDSFLHLYTSDSHSSNGYPSSSSPTDHQEQASENDVDDCAGIPSSSPPTSSPVRSYCRSSSPIPPSSPPCGSSPTPTRYPDLVADLRDLNSPMFLAGIDPSNITVEGNMHEGSGATGTGLVNEGDPNTSISISSKKEQMRSSSESGLSAICTTGAEALYRPKYQNMAPGPKRATLAAQEVQREKLSKPFRSPMVVQAPGSAAPNTPLATMSVSTMPAIPSVPKGMPLLPPVRDKIKDRIGKAAAQFKSPLSTSSLGEAVGPLVRPTATIQALERKVQVLKRAIKVRENSEVETLTKLIEKWTEAGRDIAWEVWNLVKDSEQQAVGTKRGFDESWGWQDAGESKKAQVEEEERNWGWDIVPVREREESGRRTLGTMLLALGIAPETMGWNTEEESFPF